MIFRKESDLTTIIIIILILTIMILIIFTGKKAALIILTDGQATDGDIIGKKNTKIR